MMQPPDSLYSRLGLPAMSLCWRELIRFLRERHRVIGALATPIMFWIVVGAGMGHSFRSEGPGGGNFMAVVADPYPLQVLAAILNLPVSLAGDASHASSA